MDEPWWWSSPPKPGTLVELGGPYRRINVHGRPTRDGSGSLGLAPSPSTAVFVARFADERDATTWWLLLIDGAPGWVIMHANRTVRLLSA